VIGAPFLVIEHRSGVVVRNVVPGSMSDLPDVARRLDLALVDAAADLHTVDVAGAGLDDLGRPDGFGRRQVSGWTDRWNRVAPESPIPAVDEVATILAESVPAPTRVSVVHNDLKLDNCQFASREPDTVTSVFDWDMATLGDPLFDLGLLLTSMGTLPVWVLSIEQAVGHYGERSGIDVDRIDWYLAFATWRMAIVLQQLYSRYLAGDSTDDRLAGFGAHVPIAAERARALLDR
jgi:aminoglycoside phosphotransferase (APT) family kinase protein